MRQTLRVKDRARGGQSAKGRDGFVLWRWLRKIGIDLERLGGMVGMGKGEGGMFYWFMYRG